MSSWHSKKAKAKTSLNSLSQVIFTQRTKIEKQRNFVYQVELEITSLHENSIFFKSFKFYLLFLNFDRLVNEFDLFYLQYLSILSLHSIIFKLPSSFILFVMSLVKACVD